MKFPNDVPRRKVLRTLEILGFRIVRVGNHISMVRDNPDGTKTPLTMPNHNKIKGLRHCGQFAGKPVFRERNF